MATPDLAGNALPDVGERTEWVPLSLTLVEYPKGTHNKCVRVCLEWKPIVLGDVFGKLLALISLAPFGIGAGFVTLILFRRDLHTVSCMVGGW